MFDHVTLRVADLPATEERFRALLDPLAVDQSLSSRTFAAWGEFMVTSVDAEHTVTERAHVAFVARTPEDVDAFWQAGIAAGMRDNGPPGPRAQYSPDYYGAFLLDEAGNNFEAVVHGGSRRGATIDHVAIRVADLAASAGFYRSIADVAGFELRRESPERVSFTARAPARGLLSVVAGEPTTDLHLAFAGDDEAVRRFHADALAAGYRDNGSPGERSRYHAGYYAAYVLDPDGNNIEVVDHHRR